MTVEEYANRGKIMPDGCKCPPEDWSKDPRAICDKYVENQADDCGRRCETCSHDFECHDAAPAGQPRGVWYCEECDHPNAEPPIEIERCGNCDAKRKS